LFHVCSQVYNYFVIIANEQILVNLANLTI
jgi:hypothetical protein